jgi:4-alpha-glucanotransferase
MRFERSSGIFLHPTSLPGPFGIGDFGAEAHRFVDFLAASGQALWQIMPLGPTGLGGSPYSSPSAFAGNVNLVGPELLVSAGLLDRHDVDRPPSFGTSAGDDERAREYKRGILEKAFHHFKGRVQGDPELRRDYDEFLGQASSWIEDYAFFAALKDQHHGASWWTWAPALARREPAALAQARDALGDVIEAHRFFQYVFVRQWLELRRHANERGIRVIGDMPMFVAHDSADVWSRPHLWKLDEAGRPIVVAGVPPDAFSDTGQLWGNPLYDWDRLRSEGFGWWIERMRETLKLVDIVRLDHFRGFSACWEVPATHTTAENGAWVETPGQELLRAMQDGLGGDLPLIAEDLGMLTPEVHLLRDEFGLPGMRVLQFAFGSDAGNPHLPHQYAPSVVAYTGTHDNDTVVGWFRQRGAESASDDERGERDHCQRYLATDGADIHWDFIRAVQMSVAGVSMMPLQDVLGLDSSARMNTPGRAEGNWGWRYPADALTDELAERLRVSTELYGRLRALR